MKNFKTSDNSSPFFLQVYLVERLGRRTLLLGPMCLMALSTIVITVSLNMQAIYSWMAYISIACIITFIVGFALGLGK